MRLGREGLGAPRDGGAGVGCRDRGRFAERQTHREGGASTGRALNVHGAAMQPDELAHQGEADPRALMAPPPGDLDPVEAVEHLGELGLRDADTGIGHDPAPRDPPRERGAP